MISQQNVSKRLQNTPKSCQNAVKNSKKRCNLLIIMSKKSNSYVPTKKVPPNGYFGNLTTSFLHNDRDIEGFVCKSNIFRSFDSSASEIYFRIFAALYVHCVPNAAV